MEYAEPSALIGNPVWRHPKRRLILGLDGREARGISLALQFARAAMRLGLGVRAPQVYAGASNSSRWTSMSSRGWGSATSPSGRAWPDLRCMGGSPSNRSQVPLALALAARVRSWPAGPPRKTDVRARPRTLGSCPDSTPLGRTRHRRRFPGRRGRGPCDWARTVSRPSGSSLMIRYPPFPAFGRVADAVAARPAEVTILVVTGGTQHPAGPRSIRVRFAPPTPVEHSDRIGCFAQLAVRPPGTLNVQWMLGRAGAHPA